LDDDSQFSWLLSLNHPKSEQTLLTVFFIEDQSLRTPDPLASPLPILIDQNQKISWPIRHLKLQACTPLDQRLKDGISKAVATWNAGLNGLLTIEFDGESISGDFSDLNTRCISEANPFLGGYGYANNIPATTYVVGSRHHSYLADADIFFWKGVHDQLDDDQLLSVAIHEVGHALILGEAKDESVMNSQLWLQQPQVLDIDRLHVLNE
jgi:Zn-dependent protease with chaperone function